ncbi:MAG TPA: 30S ribosomal protein THX [Chitinophagales bacterium]|nr:30S ribosomal protein THX [Chitinophagales bacterium]
MGRGDKRTAKGKRTAGSFGNSRKQKRVTKPGVKTTGVKSGPDAPAKKTAAKKTAAKKAPAKKAAAKKEAGAGDEA